MPPYCDSKRTQTLLSRHLEEPMVKWGNLTLLPSFCVHVSERNNRDINHITQHDSSTKETASHMFPVGQVQTFTEGRKVADTKNYGRNT